MTPRSPVPPPLAVLWVAATCVATTLALPATAATKEPEVELREVAWSEVRAGVLRGVIAAPAERLYRTLTDFVHWSEFMPFVASSTATPGTGGGVLCEQRLDLPFPYPDRDYRLHATHGAETTPGGRRWWVRWEDLPVAEAAGAARGGETRAGVVLRPLGGARTAVEIELWSDGGGLLPRGVQERITARSLGWILDGLRQQVQRCRYDLPRAASCGEAAPFVSAPTSAAERGGGEREVRQARDLAPALLRSGSPAPGGAGMPAGTPPERPSTRRP